MCRASLKVGLAPWGPQNSLETPWLTGTSLGGSVPEPESPELQKLPEKDRCHGSWDALLTPDICFPASFPIKGFVQHLGETRKQIDAMFSNPRRRTAVAICKVLPPWRGQAAPLCPALRSLGETPSSLIAGGLPSEVRAS